MTHVVSLYGGPGLGKSTLAAELFVELKKRGKSVELVHEYVKQWAWEGKVPSGSIDAIYIFAKQVKLECRLYNKVDFIITDSPLGLCPVYEWLYNPTSILIRSAFKNLMEDISEGGLVTHHNFHLLRKHKYVQEGRFEEESVAQQIDGLCQHMHDGDEVASAADVLRIMEERGVL
jgi:hypothetical protein